jgi:hypothetical protein
LNLFTTISSGGESMNRQQTIPRESPTGATREDWLRTGVLAGFLATFVMTVALLAAYGIASSIGDQSGNVLQRWSWALVHNPVAQRTADGVMLAIGANLAVGLVLALAYTRYIEPMLEGPVWWKGMRFSLIPWVLSLVVFLPLMGGGILGLGIGAGPLPILGNLILHLIYGAVLGETYADPVADWLDDTPADREHSAAAERGAAIGVAVGLPLGFVIGWLFAPGVSALASRTESAFGIALIGAAVGLAIGSFAGMGRTRPRSAGPVGRH